MYSIHTYMHYTAALYEDCAWGFMMGKIKTTGAFREFERRSSGCVILRLYFQFRFDQHVYNVECEKHLTSS